MSRRQQIEALLKDDPDDTFLNYALAKELVGAGDVEAGIAAFDRVLSLDPDYVPAYFQKAQTLASEGDVEAARDVLVRGIDVAQRVGDSHANGEMTAYLDTL
ncbi:MAG: tetratricopeptide repeat protein [Planctomycetota bacterium]|nr:tetratricopeptide repeat protein [Planctomycetaceae bacterium]MDQ3333369.1 tetratricopeptide repeat protein [Planctomycetota bacterium]